ncbi:MAG: DNA topoisomerase (ATP-hydrolyzing) subunit B [Defluviitaleaceae bacterium]|nr:DNA topoisomerase (ATP-hydrolyzing) subunit B [Defluviitaleaceae bacterium]
MHDNNAGNNIVNNEEINFTENTAAEYSADQIEVLEGLDPVRKRPGMYISSTSIRGLHQLVHEIMDNAVDEALAGICTDIFITIHADNSVTVSDNGRGIPVGMHKTKGVSALQLVYSTLHAGGKFGGDNSGYKVSGGLHGVGAAVVNALSTECIVTVKREGKIHQIKFSRGDLVSPLAIIGDSDETGTTVHFKPDPEVFEDIVFDFDTLKQRVRETAFLTKGLSLTLKDERQDPEMERTYLYKGGISEFVEHVNKNKTPIFDKIFYTEAVREDIHVEVALQYNENFTETTYSFVNNINTIDGGTHMVGFRAALTKTINDYGRKFGLLKENDKNLSGDDVREGLTAVISIKIQEPQFESQTKVKLGNSIARTAVESVMNEYFKYFLEENPAIGKSIIDKALLASRAREAAKKARDLVLRKSALEGNRLPGKLADCTEKDPAKCEIFLVEGDSAGGSAIGARTSKTQAILGLRGKPLNVEKARFDKILENEEIRAMITAIGVGIKDDFDIAKLRYHKIIIMADADVDGEHIRTLLLTFIYRFMPQLIDDGYVYIAQPPLFKIEHRRQIKYAYSNDEYQRLIKEYPPDARPTVSRYKGLGEMNKEQLWETTMDPERRVLKKVTIDSHFEADDIFTRLMGEKVEPRREFIEEYAATVRELDF